MKLDYLAIEKRVAAYVATLTKGEIPQLLFKKCKDYNGEFEGYDFPEDYKPGCTYCFTKIRTAANTGNGSVNPRNPRVEVEFLAFIGSHTTSRENAKEEVYERAVMTKSALHMKKVANEDSTFLGQLFWKRDEEQFAIPNHVCWVSIFSLIIERVEL